MEREGEAVFWRCSSIPSLNGWYLPQVLPQQLQPTATNCNLLHLLSPQLVPNCPAGVPWVVVVPAMYLFADMAHGMCEPDQFLWSALAPSPQQMEPPRWPRYFANPPPSHSHGISPSEAF